MDDVVSGRLKVDDHPLLRRRNSISASNLLVPTKLNLSSSTTTSSSSDDLEMLSIKPSSQSYTSLKDLLPSVAVNSPRPNSASLVQLGSDICIRNRLVKQAAWAYLQPMSTASGSTGNSFFHHLWPRIAAFFDLFRHTVIRVFDWTLRIIRIRSSR